MDNESVQASVSSEVEKDQESIQVSASSEDSTAQICSNFCHI